MSHLVRGCYGMVTESLEQITEGNVIFAIIIRGHYSVPGINFVTQDSESFQLASMSHPKGKQIDPHVHEKATTVTVTTREVLIIKKGRLRVDLYRNDQSFLTTRELGPMDVILLMNGGHGFEVLEDLEMIEVKQGPYKKDMDKTHFKPKGKSL